MAAKNSRRVPLLAGLVLTLGACSAASGVGDFFFGGGVNGPGSPTPHLEGFIGAAVADEPTAALAGQEVLSTGGSAGDAAVAIGFTLAVTYPSRASLGSGGACLAYNPAKSGPGGGSPEAIIFTPVAPRSIVGQVDRPSAVPMLARGLFALHARYGRRPFETLISPAEQLARFGTPASRAFVRDLQLVAGPLMADPDARSIFAPRGRPLADGQQMVQPDLGATLAQLRVAGVGDLYQGVLAQRYAAAAAQAGGGISLADLRAALPGLAAPLVVPAGRDRAAFLPPPADGGLAAAAAFEVLQAEPNNLAAAGQRALAVAARFRQGGASAQALLQQSGPLEAGTLPTLPASTTFATLDRNGNAVVCALTMDNLFGTGRIAPGTGIVMAASPASVPAPLLAGAIAWNPNVNGFHAAVGGSGQEGAPLAVADGLANALRYGQPIPSPVPDPGRENAIVCSRYLPDSEGSCSWATDPRGAGLALGSR